MLGALCFAAYLTGPLLGPGFNNAGDDCIHVAYCRDLDRSVSEGNGIFSWCDLYGLGAPRFIFRPPGFYISAVALHKASFGLVGIDLAEKLVYVLSFTLFPLSVAFLLKALGFRPLVVGFAALFSITAISTWGHTLDAYFYLGLAKQCVAIFLFPLVLGTFHLCVTKSLYYGFISVLLNVCMFLNHPYMSYTFFLVMGIYLLAWLLTRGVRSVCRVIAILGIMSLVFVLLLGFYLIPFYNSDEIQKTSAFSSSWRYEFEIVCQTVHETTKAWLSGGIFDTTGSYTYGTEDWGWRDNSSYGRWPILTGLSLLGLVVSIIRSKSLKFTLLGFAFLFSLTLFTGPDDFPLLLRMPFQNQFQYLHAIFLLELVAICLAGVGGAFLAIYGIRLVLFLMGKALKKSEWISGGVVLATAAILAYSPYRERYYAAASQVDLRNIGSVYGSLPDQQRMSAIDTDYDQLIDVMKTFPPEARFYFAPAGKADPIEVA